MSRRLITVKEVCTKLSISRSTLNNWVRGVYQSSRGIYAINMNFPKAIHIGKSVRFYEDEIDAFIEARAND